MSEETRTVIISVVRKYKTNLSAKGAAVGGPFTERSVAGAVPPEEIPEGWTKVFENIQVTEIGDGEVGQAIDDSSGVANSQEEPQGEPQEEPLGGPLGNTLGNGTDGG